MLDMLQISHLNTLASQVASLFLYPPVPWHGPEFKHRLTRHDAKETYQKLSSYDDHYSTAARRDTSSINKKFPNQNFHAVTKLMRFKHCLWAMLDSSHMGAICWIEKKISKN